MKEEKVPVDMPESEEAHEKINPGGLFVMPSTTALKTVESEGIFFSVPGFGGVDLKIKFIPSQKFRDLRPMYTVKVLNKKTGQMYDQEDEKLKAEVNKSLIYEAVTGWKGIKKEDGADFVFSPENRVLFLNVFGLKRVDALDEDGEKHTLISWISKCMSDPDLFFGEKKT